LPSFDLDTIRFDDPYFSLLVLSVVALGTGIAFVALSQTLGPKRYDPVKYSPYECGVDPILPENTRVSVKFYLVAILFLLFDLESVFVYPWAVLYRELGVGGFVEMAVFIGLLLAGLVYIWNKGGLEWQ
jgi:NADH-quinone oxidoreductase subunit A